MEKKKYYWYVTAQVCYEDANEGKLQEAITGNIITSEKANCSRRVFLEMHQYMANEFIKLHTNVKRVEQVMLLSVSNLGRMTAKQWDDYKEEETPPPNE